MSRYTAVDPDADRRHFDDRLRLEGVDLTSISTGCAAQVKV